MKYFSYTLTVILFSVFAASAQTVSNVTVETTDEKVLLFYDLSAKSDIQLYVSFDDGKTFKGPLKEVTGNVGKDVKPGKCMICWNALKEVGEFESERIRFKIETGDNVKASAPNGGSELTFTVKGVSFKMLYVEGGTFMMGSDDGDEDEKPVHRVTLSPYYIGQTEVTQALWRAVMATNPSNFRGDKRPVEQVSWADCQLFIAELNLITGRKFRLPTEAEWEYAARGGNKSRGCVYSGSNAIHTVAWFTDNSGGGTHDVATKRPNELGLYDMSGNVWEWCQDWYGNYASTAQTNPTGPSTGSNRVLRGGSWRRNAGRCRSSYRNNSTPDNRHDDLGLRLVLVP